VPSAKCYSRPRLLMGVGTVQQQHAQPSAHQPTTTNDDLFTNRTPPPVRARASEFARIQIRGNTLQCLEPQHMMVGENVRKFDVYSVTQDCVLLEKLQRVRLLCDFYT
jgi:hypothetical protein